jgi:hypothetical protein
MTACSDLLDPDDEDVLVRIAADDDAEVRRTRQEILASASTWGGVRVGEQTGEAQGTALEFTLPGPNLDIALGTINQLDARVVSTDIDVDPAQLERSTTTRPDDDESDREPVENEAVRLRVEVTAEPSAGLDGALRAVMAVFSIIGVVATLRWIGDRWRGRRPVDDDPDRPRRRIDRVDLREDPPTAETPQVPPPW